MRLDHTRMHIHVKDCAGILGSELHDHLLNLRRDILCIDNARGGTKFNICFLQDHPCFELLRHDAAL